MATFGAAVIAFALYVWVRWMFSGNFSPVNPGPDPISTAGMAGLVALQVFGVAAVLYLVWRFVVRPWRAERRISSDGLLILMLPWMWFWDPWMNYSQNWFTYNTHLVNLGSWTAQVPTFVAPHQDRMAEPLLVCTAYIWWVFPYMLLGCRLLNKLRARWPSMGMAGVLLWGLAGSIVIEAVIELVCVRLGFYAFPGVPHYLLLWAGTRWQYSPIYAVIAGIGCYAWVAVRYYKDDRGYMLPERGAQHLRMSERGRTGVRYMALVGGMTLSIAVFNLLCQFLALHSGDWPRAFPSYLTSTCPNHSENPASCGGPGIAIPRSDHQ